MDVLALLATASAQEAEGPRIVLTDEDSEIEEAGLEAVGQAHAPLFAGLWEKGFLKGKEGEKVVLGGYVESEYDNDLAGSSYFDQHRMVAFLFARPHDRVSFATEIEWEHGGTPRKADGELVVGESLLEFAIVDVKMWEWWQYRMGIVLVPVGAYNIRHDAPTQDLTVRPMVSTYVAPSTWFEMGAGFFGRIPFGPGMRLDYELYAINGLDSKLYDGLGTRAARGSLGEDNNHDKGIVGRIAYRPFEGLEVAGSGYRGAYDPDSTRFVNLYAGDVTARWRWLEFQGEAIGASIDPGFDEGWAGATRNPVPEGMFGFYGQINAHFMPAPLTRAMPDDLKEATFTGIVRYEEVDTNRAATTEGDRTRIQLGLNFRPIEALALKQEVLLTTNGAGGTLARPWSRGYAPDPEYVASIALLF